MNKRNIWPVAIIESIFLNIGIFFIIGTFWFAIPETAPNQAPIEVSLVSVSGGGGHNGGGSGPVIDVPRESKVTIPPPPQSMEQAEAALESATQVNSAQREATEVQQRVVNQGQNSAQMNTSKALGKGEGVGIGNDAGTGSGSGEGSGSGVGSGSGDGSGSGAGNGNGNGSDEQGETTGITPIQEVAAAYPEALRKRGVEGTVLVRIIVETDGTVSESSLIQSSGHAELDDAAVQVMYQWRFAPAKRNGSAVRASASIPYVFTLR